MSAASAPRARAPARLVRRLLSKGLNWLAEWTPAHRPLQRWRPILRLWPAPVWVVTRHADVREVLERHREFTVPYLPRMEAMTGPFILGMDESPRYWNERRALERAAGDELPARVRELSERRAGDLLAGADGRIDVVGELTDPVVHAAIAERFGVAAPDPATLLRWSRAVFWEVFINAAGDPAVTARAEAAAAEVRALLEATIAARRDALAGGEAAGDDLLDRLLAAQGGPDPFLDDEPLENSLFGLTVAWAVSVSRATALALDELLRRPRELAGAQTAARAGDHGQVGAHLIEALRFSPQAAALPRACRSGATVARGTPRETAIRPGGTVVVLLSAAMVDPRAVEAPSTFRVDRPPGDYLHFGHGLYTCFGEAIAREQMAGIATALLRRDGVRRAAGPAGTLAWEGPFPSRLVVELTRGRP